jgi:glycosyltransferase involved in cell wall biosynthesis
MTGATPVLSVVVKGWPRLSETFIAQELVALEDAGHRLELWSLRHPTETKTHPLHDRLRAPVTYLPEYLHDDPRRVARAVGAARRMPGFAEAWRIWRSDLSRDRTRNRVRRFGQACVLAAEISPASRALYAHFLHTPASVARYAAIMTGLPWGFSAHAKDIWTSPDWELREKLDPARQGAGFGATCTAYGAAHLRSLAADPGRIDLVYHGLDLARFPPPPRRPRRAPGDPFALLSVGRLVEKKGFDRLIDALTLVGTEIDWHWTHIGGGELGRDLKARAAQGGIADRITWRGACDQTEVIAAMQAADAFVLPSRITEDGDRDGLPNVLMEAASQKLPVVTTAVSAIPEFITDGEHGLLVPDDPPALAEALLRLARDPVGAAHRAAAAHARLISEFRMEPGIRQLSDRLTALMGT